MHDDDMDDVPMQLEILYVRFVLSVRCEMHLLRVYLYLARFAKRKKRKIIHDFSSFD